MEFGKPRQSLTGIVGAEEDRGWTALLETSPYLTPRMREMIAGSRGLLRYQVFNVAPGLTRWLVPLVAGPALRASARPQFERALTAIGSLLGCPARIAG